MVIAVTPTPRVARAKDGRITILAVDDNPDNMRVTRDILGKMSVNLLQACDGKEALESAKSNKPDIILIDINLPVISGLEVTKMIRQDKDIEGIVIIALTAKAMMGDKEEILAAGCDDYLSKPVEPGMLRATIEKWIAG